MEIYIIITTDDFDQSTEVLDNYYASFEVAEQDVLKIVNIHNAERFKQTSLNNATLPENLFQKRNTTTWDNNWESITIKTLTALGL